MFTLKPLPEFEEWLAGLKDSQVGGGVTELRIHLGAGWRVYYAQHRRIIIVLLCGGTKRTQKRDIQRARKLAARLDWPEG